MAQIAVDGGAVTSRRSDDACLHCGCSRREHSAVADLLRPALSFRLTGDECRRCSCAAFVANPNRLGGLLEDTLFQQYARLLAANERSLLGLIPAVYPGPVRARSTSAARPLEPGETIVAVGVDGSTETVTSKTTQQQLDAWRAEGRKYYRIPAPPPITLLLPPMMMTPSSVMPDLYRHIYEWPTRSESRAAAAGLAAVDVVVEIIRVSLRAVLRERGALAVTSLVAIIRVILDAARRGPPEDSTAARFAMLDMTDSAKVVEDDDDAAQQALPLEID